MSHGLTHTEVPEYFLEKEYTEKPKPEDLHEIFIIIYVMEVPNYRQETDDDTRYIFFTNLEKAYKRFKMFVNGKAMLKRVYTDNEKLYEVAQKNDNITVIAAPEEGDVSASEESVDNGSIKRSTLEQEALDKEIDEVINQVKLGNLTV